MKLVAGSVVAFPGRRKAHDASAQPAVIAHSSLVAMYLGLYDVGTGNHDNAPMNWALDMAMTRSVARHARGIKAPNLTDPAMIERGFRHYHAMCIECHGAPGVAQGEIAKGLFPEALDLSESASDWIPEQRAHDQRHHEEDERREELYQETSSPARARSPRVGGPLSQRFWYGRGRIAVTGRSRVYCRSPQQGVSGFRLSIPRWSASR